MRRAGSALSIGLVLGACGSTATDPGNRSGTSHISARGACAERQDGLHPSSPPEIDSAVPGILSASGSVITVRSLSGPAVCIPLSWIDTIDEVYLSEDGRLLDFDHAGDQDRGHFLVDRRARVAIETGTQPESSDDGTMLAAVPPARHDEEGVDEIGVWHVLPDRIERSATVTPPEGEAWRVERWVGNGCVELSAVAAADYWGPDIDGGDSDAAEAAIARLPRLHFSLRPIDGVWRVTPSRDTRPCLHVAGPDTGV